MTSDVVVRVQAVALRRTSTTENTYRLFNSAASLEDTSQPVPLRVHVAESAGDEDADSFPGRSHGTEFTPLSRAVLPFPGFIENACVVSRRNKVEVSESAAVVISTRQRIVNKYTPDLFARRPAGRQA